ncbi:amidohydrolase family protein [Phenylobacterium aquaticum]|uniref:amidohydrolase family protein n=1 Tax=Phenylobacterium aquaticum TaxID=1763816 RepID=UPI0026EF6D54|nr:amidohydrolase family protein [Phenylobacterium aquaticum]
MLRQALMGAAAIAAFALPATAETVAVTHARILTAGPAGEIAQGTLVLRDGKIVAAGANVAVPAGARVIDAAGGVVTPGFFATDSVLGAQEVGSLGSDLRVSNPALGAAMDVQYGLNPASTLIPVARLGGLTSAIVMPHASGGGGEADEGDEMTSGGVPDADPSHALFAGQAAVVTLGQGPDILAKAKVAMVVPFGQAGAKIAGGARGAEFVAFKAALQDVRDYARNKAGYDKGESRALSLSKADLEALIPVVQGRMPIIAEVHRAADILAVLKLAKDENLKVILNGAEEGWMVAADIAKAGVPVLVYPLSDRSVSFEQLGSTLDNAGRLAAAGVVVAIESDDGGHRARETRYDAGNAVSHGMAYAAALAAVTINPAKIFGVADRTGSIEPGKDADVVIWTGDPFEPLSQASAIFVRGVQQPMTSRQLELRDRYKDLNRALPPAYSH